MKFDVESTEFLNLMRPDVSFPHHHFAMLADEARCQVGIGSVLSRHGCTAVWGFGSNAGDEACCEVSPIKRRVIKRRVAGMWH